MYKYKHSVTRIAKHFLQTSEGYSPFKGTWSYSPTSNFFQYLHPNNTMPLGVHKAKPSDVPLLADIYFAAFARHPLYEVAYNTPALKKGHRECFVKDTLLELEDSRYVVLVVRESDEIIAFARWDLPIQEDDKRLPLFRSVPDEMDMSIFDRILDAGEREWIKQVEGSQPCYGT